MYEYENIPEPYVRDPDSKKFLRGWHSRDEIAYLHRNLWVCIEKIKGIQAKVIWDGAENRIQFHSQSKPSVKVPESALQLLQDTFRTDEMRERLRTAFGMQTAVLYCECFGGDVRQGEAYSKDCSLVVFDVYFPKKHLYLDFTDAIEVVERKLGLKFVPLVGYMTLDAAMDYVQMQPASFFGDAPLYGLICRPSPGLLDLQGNRIAVKLEVKELCEAQASSYKQ